MDPSSLAALITAIGVSIGAIGAGVSAVVSAIRTSQRVKHIDHAVNGKRPGEAAMVEQVSDLHADRPLVAIVADMAEELNKMQKRLDKVIPPEDH